MLRVGEVSSEMEEVRQGRGRTTIAHREPEKTGARPPAARGQEPPLLVLPDQHEVGKLPSSGSIPSHCCVFTSVQRPEAAERMEYHRYSGDYEHRPSHCC